MTDRQSQENQNPLRHDCPMTSGNVGLISYLDTSDVVALGLAFYLAGQLSPRISPSPTLKIMFIVLACAAAWFINFGIKRRLQPYPRFVEFFTNWWMNGIDFYKPDVDADTPPLIVTKEMELGHAFERIERQAKREVVKIERQQKREARVQSRSHRLSANERRKRVQKS